MKQILLVEDNESLGRGIAMALENGQVTVRRCTTLAQGRQALSQAGFDLVILDIGLPDGSGLELLHSLRQKQDPTPVMVLTANDLELEEVTSLESGADDFIGKPFSLAVLRARVNAQLRRSRQEPEGALALGPFLFDFVRMDFRREGQPVELSKTEQRLLRVLVENRGYTVPREVLVDRVWTDGAAFVEENALSVTVKRLRSKLEADPAHPAYLKTVYGIGYTWQVKP